MLLPTRDRLDLLRSATTSIMRLDDLDYEVVISDNDSSEDIEGYVASLNDSRIRYVRTPELLPVTDNWNNALAHSTGDYVIMLGDDDALLSNYAATVRRLVNDFGDPQVTYHNALCYAYPGVIPSEPDGFLRGEGYARFLRHGARRPFRLPHDQARRLTCASANFQLTFGFNMQCCLPVWRSKRSARSIRSRRGATRTSSERS
jgi:glycosyltransferase involved in cell wall biosynthesis